jgi:hypothetical protein
VIVTYLKVNAHTRLWVFNGPNPDGQVRTWLPAWRFHKCHIEPDLTGEEHYVFEEEGFEGLCLSSFDVNQGRALASNADGFIDLLQLDRETFGHSLV